MRLIVILLAMGILALSASASEPHRVDIPLEADGYTFVGTCLTTKENPEVGFGWSRSSDCLCYYDAHGDRVMSASEEFLDCPRTDQITKEKNRAELERRSRNKVKQKEDNRSRLRDALER